MKSFSLKGKWVLITGASSGFGAAGAIAFGAQGAKLLLGARRVDRLEQVAKEAEKAGASEVHVHALDVSKTKSVNDSIEWVQTKTKEVHVLVNNAGGALGLDTIAEGKDDDWETMMQTNVLGVLRMTRAVLPLIPHDAGATIMTIGSHADRAPYDGGSAYCGVKAAAAQITRVLRLELCGTGIRVSLIAPGLAETEFSVVRFKGDIAKAKKPYEGTIPLVGEDIAEAMVWVASRPPHVDIDELVIKPTDQAAMHKIFRRKAQG
jgi:3-hydroxy acid dehydrogenase / malonic semialdehyde reductase